MSEGGSIGPAAPGAGVLGRGGIPIPRKEDPVAAGVIGLAGDTAIPLISDSGNVGVYGAGPAGGVRGSGQRFGVEGLSKFMGVSGQGVGGPGVNGVGRPGVVGIAADDSTRGGEFSSKGAAQVRLVPHRLQQRIPNQVAVVPTAIEAGSEPALAKQGRAGDLMVIEMETEDKQQVCRLWLCVQSTKSGRPARWSQVTAGPLLRRTGVMAMDATFVSREKRANVRAAVRAPGDGKQGRITRIRQRRGLHPWPACESCS